MKKNIKKGWLASCIIEFFISLCIFSGVKLAGLINNELTKKINFAN